MSVVSGVELGLRCTDLCVKTGLSDVCTCLCTEALIPCTGGVRIVFGVNVLACDASAAYEADCCGNGGLFAVGEACAVRPVRSSDSMLGISALCRAAGDGDCHGNVTAACEVCAGGGGCPGILRIVLGEVIMIPGCSESRSDLVSVYGEFVSAGCVLACAAGLLISGSLLCM